MAQRLLEKASGIFVGKITNQGNERMAELERLVGPLRMEKALLKRAAVA
jgi:hypothetical protein